MGKKNIIMILTDQMHKKALGLADDNIITPNLDALAHEGVRFTNAYSNNPVCGPMRGCLFTGKYTCENRVYENNYPLPNDTKCMAEVFNEDGYDTSFVGKWHLGGKGNCPIPKGLRGGFNHFIGYQCYNGFWTDNYFYNEDNEAIGYDGHRTDITTDIAIDRLKILADGDKPFLHVIFYQAPHYPEQPSDEYAAMYMDKGMEYPPNYIETEPYTPTYSPRSPRPYKYCHDYKRYGGNMDEYKRLYNAMVTQIDDGIGKIISELKELDLYDDALILFSSDHGDLQGSHGLTNKCKPYEESCGIPLIMKYPDVKKQSVIDTPVSCIDYMTTAMAFAGIWDTQELEGRDLIDICQNEINYTDDFIVAENYHNNDYWTMIRDKRYKLVVDTFTKECTMLFDMDNDEYEMNNLIDNSKFNSIKLKLYNAFDEWLSNRSLLPQIDYSNPIDLL